MEAARGLSTAARAAAYIGHERAPRWATRCWRGACFQRIASSATFLRAQNTSGTEAEAVWKTQQPVQRWRSRLLLRGFGIAHRRALQGDAVRVVDDAIEDGVGQRGVVQVFVPVLDGQLAGDDARSTADPIVHLLEQIGPLRLVEGRDSPVIDQQHVGAPDGGKPPSEAAVAVGDMQLFEQRGQTDVEHREALATSGIAQSTSEPGLADPGLTGDQDVLRTLV